MDNPYEPPTVVSTHGDGHLVNRGGLVVLFVIGFVVTFSLLTILLFNVVLGSQKLPAQVVRFFLTIGLAACLYRGHSWARYLMAILFGLGAIVGIFALPLTIANAPPVMLAYFAVMIGGYAASSISLVILPSVGKFLIHQQSRQA